MELRIKEILKEKGLTLKDVAERTGTDSSNLASMLKKGNPKLNTLEDIAHALGVEVYELFVRSEEPVKEAAKDNQALVMLNGEIFKLTRAKDIVKLPVFTDYSELRNNLKGFVQRAEKYDKKLRNNEPDAEEKAKGFAFTGMVETFEVFTLLYVPETATFHLVLCYKNGRTLSYSYDARNEFNKGAEGDWDTEQLYLEIRNDIEEVVKAKSQSEKE